jgi:tetratricopeptide (TPR) repeat protein
MTPVALTPPPELDTDVLDGLLHAPRGDHAAELRALITVATELQEDGHVDDAMVKLERARALAEDPAFDDAHRAEVVFHLGSCRLKLGAVSNAVQLLSVALDLADRCGMPCDRLRSDILIARSKCYRRQRDWDGARADADAAVVLAEQLGDAVRVGDAYMQASQVAERTGQLLVARFYIERAAEIFRDGGDLVGAGRALNNLGGILFLLGRHDEAVARLQEAFAIALELDETVDAAYAVSSTAQVLLRGGDAAGAEVKARYALELLDGREDHASEIGSAGLVLGRALTELGRFDEAEVALHGADESFRRMDSLGHRAAAWLAQGDLAARTGRIEDAATVYRRAAEALQDVRF